MTEKPVHFHVKPCHVNIVTSLINLYITVPYTAICHSTELGTMSIQQKNRLPETQRDQNALDQQSEITKSFAPPAFGLGAGPVQARMANGQSGNTTPFQLKEEEDEKTTQRKEGGSFSPAVQRKATEGGIPDEVKGKMENSIGADFSDVKVHTNSQSAVDMGALAYTQGSDVHFAPGQYDPSSSGGQELLGHELTHVKQQKEGRVQANSEVNGQALNNESSLEGEADQMGAKAAQANVPTQLKSEEEETTQKKSTSNGTIQAKAEPEVEEKEDETEELEPETEEEAAELAKDEEVEVVPETEEEAAEMEAEEAEGESEIETEAPESETETAEENLTTGGQEEVQENQLPEGEVEEEEQVAPELAEMAMSEEGVEAEAAVPEAKAQSKEEQGPVQAKFNNTGSGPVVQQWGFLKKVGKAISGGAKKAWGGVKKAGKSISRGAKKAWGGIKSGAKKAWGGIKRGAKKVWGGVKSGARKAWGGIKRGAKKAWGGIKSGAKKVWGGAKKAWGGIKRGAKKVWGGIKKGAKKAWGGIKKAGSWVAKKAKKVWNGVKSGAIWAWGKAKTIGKAILNYGVDVLKKGGDLVWSWITKTPGRIWELIKHVGKGGVGVVKWLWNGAKTLFTNPGALGTWFMNGLKGGAAWLGRFIGKVADVFGVGEIMDFVWRIFKVNSRSLTPVEMAEARRVFGNSINLSQVRIDENSLIAKIGAFFQGSAGMGVTTFHTINFNRPISAAPGNSDMHWLIHELTHVAQYEAAGSQYLGEAIAAQAGAGYAYGGPGALAGKNLSDFNREQQGDIVADYYTLLSSGGDTSAYDPLIAQLRAGGL